ncbi:glycosyltransferase family 2 protein [Actinomyces sp. MRS3W]|uniref:glycosyltransferase family 2 protein n=1 Tax=Actinomyces sp. MRS3W TaxID=2800796 RepID=UPI0028FD1F6C|nr:glycosyltransferase family 2 protein [Actinomyces sp. MRS3W]MDU0348527.1 glycosyltransferase family 2 protein [Actinomyces sp. MRS3W]
MSANSSTFALLRSLDCIGWSGAIAMVVVALTYLVALALAARRSLRHQHRQAAVGDAADTAAEPLHIVVLMPCLNEETVIGASVRRLLSVNDPHVSVLVIDDGSDDATSQIVRAIADERVSLLRRHPPHARQGKGAALNDALGAVRRRYAGLNPDRVIVGVVDADGHLDPTAWDTVRDAFRSADVGAVQLGVRIANRSAALLARMQDIEFVTFTAIFQNGRRRLGSVGMGGNAQFARLSALNALGECPWTDSLTEDFDLGIRLNATRWTNEYRGEAAVHQEGVTSLRRLVRQRTRWFQGNLQARRLLGAITRDMRGRARADTLWQVLSPYLLLAGSLLTMSFALILAVCMIRLICDVPQTWAWVPGAYLLAFGPSYLYALIYWRAVRVEGSGPIHCLLWCHVFVLYGLLAGIYGWRALAREIVGRSGWAKTAREGEAAGRSQAPEADPQGAPL